MQKMHNFTFLDEVSKKKEKGPSKCLRFLWTLLTQKKKLGDPLYNMSKIIC